MKGKKAAVKMSGGQLVALLAVLLIGVAIIVGVVMYSVQPTPAPEAVSVATPSDLVEAGGTADVMAGCDNTPNPNFSVTGVNNLISTSIDYVTGSVVHFRNIASPDSDQIDATLTGATAVSGTGKCGRTYDIVVETQTDAVNGAYLDTIKVKDPATGEMKDVAITLPNVGRTVELKLQNITLLQARVKNLFEDDFMYDTSDTNNKDYESLGSSLNFTSITDNATCTTINSGENTKADFLIEVQGASEYGQLGMKTLLGVDYKDDSNPTDWDEPDVYMNNVKLSSISLSKNDADAETKYELWYDLGKALGAGSVDQVRIKAKPGSGVNPDFDLSWKLAGTGIVESSKAPNTYLGISQNVIRGDDTSDTEIVTATEQLGKICID